MQPNDFEQSPDRGSSRDETREGNPFEGRGRGRRRHGPRHGGHGEGGREREGRRGVRGRRGSVPVAILFLLAERPMHGYEMMQELVDRTQGIWRPSPGSLYPALHLLEEKGLVTSEDDEGRRRFSLTEKGRLVVKARTSGAPWETMVDEADPGELALRAALRHVSVAVNQVAEAGSVEQKAKAEALLKELRRQMYLVLSEPLASEAE